MCQIHRTYLVGQLAFSCCARQLTLLPWVDLNLAGISNSGGDRPRCYDPPLPLMYSITGRAEAGSGSTKIEPDTITKFCPRKQKLCI